MQTCKPYFCKCLKLKHKQPSTLAKISTKKWNILFKICSYVRKTTTSCGHWQDDLFSDKFAEENNVWKKTIFSIPSNIPQFIRNKKLQKLTFPLMLIEVLAPSDRTCESGHYILPSPWTKHKLQHLPFSQVCQSFLNQ